MCQILYKKKGLSLKNIKLEEIAMNNPHGIGVAVIRNKTVVVDKTITTVKELRKKYGDDNLELVIHFRLATGASAITKENSHPFSFNDENRNKLEFVTSERLLFHNGIVSEYEGNKEVDTYNFIKFALSQNKNYKDILNIYSKYNRFVLIEPGKIELYGGFIEREGIFYANTSGLTNYNYNLLGGKKWR